MLIKDVSSRSDLCVYAEKIPEKIKVLAFPGQFSGTNGRMNPYKRVIISHCSWLDAILVYPSPFAGRRVYHRLAVTP